MAVLAMVAALLCALAAGLIGFGWIDWTRWEGWLAAALFFEILAGFLPAATARWTARPPS